MKDGVPYKGSTPTRCIRYTDELVELPAPTQCVTFCSAQPGFALDFDLDLAVKQSKRKPGVLHPICLCALCRDFPRGTGA